MSYISGKDRGATCVARIMSTPAITDRLLALANGAPLDDVTPIRCGSVSIFDQIAAAKECMQVSECVVGHGGGAMRHSQLSNEQILLALSESYNVVAAITKYQVFLTSGIGLPKDDQARSELLTADIKVLEKIRTEIRALEHELDRREDQEKRRL
jgi:hypothetical protein